MSVLLATALLNYSLAHFISLPGLSIPIEAPGIFVPLSITTSTLSAATSAGLLATGADWLFRSHPSRGNRSTLPHLVLPSLTAWILSIPLSRLTPGPSWWLALAGAALILLAVLNAEYAALDPQDSRNPFSNAILISIAYAILTILAITLQSVTSRLLFLLPSLALAAALVHLRVLHIQFSRWFWLESSGASLITVAIASPLHYLNISPVAYGLVILGALYSYIAVHVNQVHGRSARRYWVEPMITIVLVLILAFLIRI